MRNNHISWGWRRCSVIALLALCALPAQARWYTYKECRLVPNDFNDGDSFHVETKSGEKLFRLYFVDSPETDDSIEGRPDEQAEYWGIAKAEALKVGKEAARFAREFLGQGPFTVYSQRHDARGRSDMPRFFAMVQLGDKYLSAELVRNGLARIYGRVVDLPDGTDGWKYEADLKVAERQAKKAGQGAWAYAGKSLKVSNSTVPTIEAQDVTLTRRAAVYSRDPRPRFLGFINVGAHVKVEGAQSAAWVRVTFNVDGDERQGLCRRTELGL